MLEHGFRTYSGINSIVSHVKAGIRDFDDLDHDLML